MSSLSRTERLIHGTVRVVNRRPMLKRWSHAFLRSVGTRWMHYCSRHVLRVGNLEALRTLPPDRSVVVAANHRSYADMYLLSSIVLPECRWIERMYFPVRSEFIYDHPAGLVVNALVAGMAMYPPVYRQPARRALNRDTIAFLVGELQRPGTLIGMHPEGRRSKTADPYTLLPAQPGIGEIVHRALPVVLPAFVNGVPADLVAGLRSNFGGNHDRTMVTITFGEPLTFDAYRDIPAGPRTSLRIAEEIRAAIERLGVRDREFRER